LKCLSIVIPFLNDGESLVHTLENISETSKIQDLDIIVVDDHSNTLTFDETKKFNIRYMRNRERMGVAYSRDIGSHVTQSDNILFLDAHMRFKESGWVEKITSAINRSPNTLFCSTCIPMSSEHDDLSTISDRYYGATIELTTNQKGLAREIIEPKWITEHDSDTIPCVLGACYAFNKAKYHSLRGLEGLKGWGGDEIYLSMKYWLSGGSCELLSDLEVGHLFRDKAPYKTDIPLLILNKIFICSVLFPENISSLLIDKLPRDPDFEEATMEFRRNLEQIIEYRKYYKEAMEEDFSSVCQLLNIHVPDV